MATAGFEDSTVQQPVDSNLNSGYTRDVTDDSSVAEVVDSVMQHENQQRISSRIRTLTEKGISYSKQQLADRCNSIWKRVHHEVQRINQKIQVSTSTAVVEDECREFNKLLMEYDIASTAHRSLLDDNDLADVEVELQQREKFVSEFKTSLYSWLHTHKHPEDCISPSSSARSLSGASAVSKSSRASERAMEKMAKLAALSEARKFAEREAEIERDKLKAEQIAKQLQIDKEMAVAHAELAVYEQFDERRSERLAATCSSPMPGVNTLPLSSCLADQNVSHQTTGPRTVVSSYHLPSGILYPGVNWSSSCLPKQQSVSHPLPTVVPNCSAVMNNQSVVNDAQPISVSTSTVLPIFNPYVPPPVSMSQQLRPPIMSVTSRPQQLPCLPRSYSLQQNQPLMTISNGHQSHHSTSTYSEEHSERSSGSDSDKILASLSEAINRGNLPKLDLSVFSGDPIEFQQWLVSFEKMIEDSTAEPARRMHYLMQYTSGNARSLVSGHALNQTEIGYSTAKEELMKEFGNPYILARAYLKQIEIWKNIPPNDASALKALCIFLKKCRGSMPSLKHLQQLNTDIYLQKIVSKLSVHLQANWRKVVDRLEQDNKEITFNELVEFIDQQARIAKHPVFSSEALQDNQQKPKGESWSHSTVNKSFHDRPMKPPVKTKSVLSTTVAEIESGSNTEFIAATLVAPRDTKSQTCPECEKLHDLDDCDVFNGKTLEERKTFLMKKRLCFGCYKHMSKQHDVRSCRRRKKCKTCGKMHPTSLHGPNFETRPKVETTDTNQTEVKVLTSLIPDASDGDTAMSIIMVRLSCQHDPSLKVTVYAALDSMSTACFISRDIWRQLGSPGIESEITIKTVTGESKQHTSVVKGLQVSSLCSDKIVSLPKVYTQDSLPISVTEAPSHDMLLNYPHLSHLRSEIPDRDVTIPVGLIIGANCPNALQPYDVIHSVNDSPYAVKTALGWCISGPVKVGNVDVLSCNRIKVSNRTSVNESGLKEMILQMYESDFIESFPASKNGCSLCISDSPVCLHGRATSQEDKRFMEIMDKEIKFIDGHYQLPLPFRDMSVTMPNNRNQVLQRAIGIRKRFAADPKFHADYTKFMNEIIHKGYAKKVVDNERHDEPVQSNLWYIPHHAVYNPHKPGKIRVVFDCSCKYQGVSLNSSLLQGPDLTNSLIGVLIRFRQKPIAIMADVESMFYQVRVPEHQRDFIRFVWWPNGDINKELEDYQMTVHLFGATSSPSCTNFALLAAAKDNEESFGKAAADTLRNNFYVDDMLKSVESKAEAVSLIRDTQKMCMAGGFRLTKFVSNCREVLETVPVFDRAQNTVNVSLSQTTQSIERALGVHWCVQNDMLGFRILLKDKPCTRRGILSTISSIFDPLGLASPFLLRGKKLLQHLCNDKRDWDDEIDGDEYTAWEQWRSNLPLLESIEVERCFKPINFGHVVSTELHHFSDASLIGYGQCSYLRLCNTNGQVHCTLVIGKSRVTPTKPVTVPRLELMAATVSAKVGRMLEKELQYDNLNGVYWTDSQAVLGYVNNDARRFHTFVANRVQQIHDNTNVSAWHYVKTDENPADDASRGIDCSNILKNQRWFRGPSFLWETEEFWSIPQLAADQLVEEADPELKRVTICASQVVEEGCNGDDSIDKFIQYFSSWYTLKRATGWILVAIDQLHNKVKQNQTNVKEALTVDDLQRAEVAILKYVQRRNFSDEIMALRQKVNIKKTSSLLRLSPVIATDGLLRVGGRLKHSTLPDDSKHQIILPKKHHVTSLIVTHYHQLCGHSGKEFVLSLIREKYWIMGARYAVRQVTSKCVTCRRNFSRPFVQEMACLPSDRITPDKPPFTFTGLDYFGPFMIKQGRNLVKRYGCIFTCLNVRAVHIEVAHTLDTDSFINALQRFISRRGQPYEIRSDNGSNFVGAERELREAAQIWNKSQVQDFMRQKEIRWKFNPPSASHMGGVWERQIKTVRKLLSTMINQQRLNDESLHTTLCIIENIINSRPISTVSDDPADLEPLTPNHLLQLRNGSTLPPGTFVKQDLYCRRRWRQVQYLADIFWRRWTKEYLPSLQLRSKWTRKQRNIQVDDIVLIVDDGLPRNCWLLGRVIKTCPGPDGLVRVAEIKTKSSVLIRPIHKLCLVKSVDDYN